MNWHRIIAVSHKEWREIVRDKVFFALAFLVPVSMMILLGYGLSLDVEGIPLAILDDDHSSASREYAYRFIGSRYFDFRGYVDSERDLNELLTDNRIRAAVIIPPDFEKNLLSAKAVAVQTLIDGTFPFRAQTTKGYVIAINAAANMDMLAGHLSKILGTSEENIRRQLQPVRLETRYLYNQSLKSIWSLAPKLIMLILMISPPFLTALGVVREKESGSIYNIYVSTVSRAEFLVGKLFPYVAISMVNAAVLFLLATALFGAPFKGSVSIFFLATLLYVVCTTGIGLLVSVFVRTQIAAMIVASIVTLVPAVLYSGVLIPIFSLETTARIIAHLLPAMYYTNIVTACFMKGTGIGYFWLDVLILAGYAALLMGFGYALFRKRTAT
ncbi:ABC transporter permease [Desulfatirhabdium butyrativorans]|uniref:ABC transporter permease n=1 Tax=Desulfatirhabdium butyrativorans TaxID=340467 RepID=UPI000412C06B|nr:ABC transporter permease [Desulfatirhabdium butyrativorans]